LARLAIDATLAAADYAVFAGYVVFVVVLGFWIARKHWRGTTETRKSDTPMNIQVINAADRAVRLALRLSPAGSGIHDPAGGGAVHGGHFFKRSESHGCCGVSARWNACAGGGKPDPPG
jgi:hypothetical protein